MRLPFFQDFSRRKSPEEDDVGRDRGRRIQGIQTFFSLFLRFLLFFLVKEEAGRKKEIETHLSCHLHFLFLCKCNSDDYVLKSSEEFGEKFLISFPSPFSFCITRGLRLFLNTHKTSILFICDSLSFVS